MNNSHDVVEQFRSLTNKKFAFLEVSGIHRMPSLEETNSIIATMVYLGRNVGFVFSLDLRDLCVEAQVVKIQGGQMKWYWEGGYSSDIFGHLVNHMGYRGSPAPVDDHNKGDVDDSILQKMIDGWAALLQQAGHSLLIDSVDSLP